MKLALTLVACIAALVVAAGALGAPNPNPNGGQPSQSPLPATNDRPAPGDSQHDERLRYKSCQRVRRSPRLRVARERQRTRRVAVRRRLLPGLPLT